MFTLNAKEIVNCLNGSPRNFQPSQLNKIDVVATNHNNAKPGCVFVALKGEKFDGHSFASHAIKNGALFAVVEHEQKNIPQVIVANTRQALLNIAQLNRQFFKGPLIAVTGSVGKTTTKDLIALALSSSKTVLKTQANLNNEIGLAQTLLSLNSTHTAAVVEMGMSHANEISKMSIATSPTIGVLTNVGSSHFENFKNFEGILNAKLEILDGMSANSPVVFNADNQMLKNCNFKNRPTIACALENSNADVFASNIEQFPDSLKFQANLKSSNKSVTIQLPLIGLHNILNALFSIAIADHLNLNLELVSEALKTFKPTGLRQKILNHNNIKIFADCYNASPESMSTALISISQTPCVGKKIAVLGDMLELGEIAEPEHKKIGVLLDKLQFDEILCIGELSKHIANSTKKPSHHFETAEQLTSFLKAKLKPQDLVLFKASHAMNLDEIIKQICNSKNLNDI